jgi:hypothetical protein
MQHQSLLETYLRQLKLPSFAHNYAAFAKSLRHALVSPVSATCWPSVRQRLLSVIPIG